MFIVIMDPSSSEVKVIKFTEHEELSWNTHVVDEGERRYCADEIINDIFERHNIEPTSETKSQVYKDDMLPVSLLGCALETYKSSRSIKDNDLLIGCPYTMKSTFINSMVKDIYGVTILQCPECSELTTDYHDDLLPTGEIECKVCKFKGHTSEYPDFIN